MSSGIDLRKRLVRKDPPKRKGRHADPSPLSAIDAGSPGEIRISNDAMVALNHLYLYHASPSIQAALARPGHRSRTAASAVRTGL